MDIRRLARRIVRAAGFSRRIAPSFSEVMFSLGTDLVLDVGANDGAYGREIRDAGYRGRILSFEPNPQAFRRLENAVNRDAAWKIEPLGLGDETKVLKLNISNADVFSSFKNLNAFGEMSSGSQVVDEVEVQVVRLDDYLKRYDVHVNNAYLKVDTQGFEREVLAGMGERISEVSAIQIEAPLVSSYMNDFDWVESILYMRERGFEVATVVCNSVVPGMAQIRELDIVFVRQELRP